MDLADLQSAIRHHFRERGAELGLIADRFEIEYVLNWGGFVNRSFRVSDGRKSFHLKLADTPETLDALRRWRDLGKALEPYHAPPILAWVDLAGTPFAGPLTAWIDGRPPDRMKRELADEVLPVIARLHADAGLAARLGAPSNCAATYLETYSDRFAEDLEYVARHPPPFVSEGKLRVMREEAARLEAIVRCSAAFDEPARSPIHADLWADNFLFTADGAWHLIDWDELRIGDPMLDYAMLLGPSASYLRPLDCFDQVEPFLASDAERERLALYARASLLDWAIDSLADYIDAGAAPEHAARVRAEKKRIHVEALDLYATLYPG
jgi:Ser/Thr protein kinase RdoA (MazF antagonist)